MYLYTYLYATLYKLTVYANDDSMASPITFMAVSRIDVQQGQRYLLWCYIRTNSSAVLQCHTFMCRAEF